MASTRGGTGTGKSISGGTDLEETGVIAGSYTNASLTVDAQGRLSAASDGAAVTGVNTGDITLATVGSTPASAGASLSGQVLTLQPADGTHAGVVSTASQTFGGAKTFSLGVAAPSMRITDTSIFVAAAIPSGAGTNNVLIGTGSSGSKLTAGGANNVLIGGPAGVFVGGDGNVAIGTEALDGLSIAAGTCNGTVAIGSRALADTNQPPSESVAIGSAAMLEYAGGDQNIAIGVSAMSSGANGSQNIAIGSLAGLQIGSDDNVMIGSNVAASATTSSRLTLIGTNANATSTGVTEAIALGYGAVATASNSCVIGNASLSAVRPGATATCDLGTSSVKFKDLYASGTLNAATVTATGAISGSNYSGTSSGTNTGDITLATVGSVPANAGASLSGQILTLQPADATHAGLVSTTSQIFEGAKTFNSTIASSNFVSLASLTQIGNHFFASTTQTQIGNAAGGAGGSENTSVGVSALAAGTGSSNTAVGFEADLNVGSGTQNTAIGAGALRAIASNSNATAIGYHALTSSSGGSNTACGASAGLSNLAGTSNTFLGASADCTTGALTNSIALGSGAQFAASNTCVIGNSSLSVISPGATATCDLGTSLVKFKDLYASGTVNTVTLTATGAISGSNYSGTSSGTNTGDVTFGNISGETADATHRGATLSSQAITLDLADATHPGLVSTQTQTIAGAKTFNGSIIAASSIAAGSDNAVDLATSSTRFRDAYFKGMVTAKYKVPSAPVVALALTTNSNCLNFDIQGDYVYLNCVGTQKFEIYDISSTTPVLISSTADGASTGGNSAIRVAGKYAYQACQSGTRFNVWNISNPKVPTVVSTVTPIFATDHFVLGKHIYGVYTTGGVGTLDIWDISNPAAVVKLSTTALSATCFRIRVQYPYAYLMAATDLLIYDISAPASTPSLISTTSTGLTAGNLAVRGAYAYILDSGGTLSIYNITDPTTLVVVLSSLAIASGAYGCDLQGDYLYVVTSTAVYVVDVSIPASSSVLAGSVTLSGTLARWCVARGRYLYVTNNGGKTLSVIDIGGAFIQHLQAGSVKAETIGTESLRVQQSLDVRGGVTIGNGFVASANSAVTGNFAASGSVTGGTLIVGNTNTIISPALPTGISSATTCVAIGTSAASGLTSGSSNVAIGNTALGGSTLSGARNVGIGFKAGQFVSSGASNVAIGDAAMQGDTGTPLTGLDNVAVGHSAGLLLQGAATQDTFVGASAGAAVTTAINNTALGYQALLSATTGQNTAVGALALGAANAADCTAVGYNALHQNTAANTTAVGSGALAHNTSGTLNTAVGQGALAANLTGGSNTAIGVNALSALLSNNSTAVGANAGANLLGTDNTMFGNTTGQGQAGSTGTSNTGVGPGALNSLTTGSLNAAFGSGALFSVADGKNNMGFGDNTGAAITSGSDNVCIGSSANVTGSGASKQIAIGGSATCPGNNRVRIGDGTMTDLTFANTAFTIGTTAAGGLPVGNVFTKNVALKDTTGLFDVTLGATSTTTISANRTLTLDVDNANRTLKLSGDLTATAAASVSGTNTGDVTFATATDSAADTGLAAQTGQAVTLGLATGTRPGLMSATTQTIGGTKSFTGIAVNKQPTAIAASQSLTLTSMTTASQGAMFGRYVLATTGSNLTVVDADNAPGAAGLNLQTGVTIGSSLKGIKLFGRYALLCSSGDSSFYTINLNNASSAALSGTLTHADLANAWDVGLCGRYAIVVTKNGANPNSKMVVVDVGVPPSPTYVSTTTLPGTDAISIYVTTKYAFVLQNGSNNLLVYILNNIAAITLKSTTTVGTLPVKVVAQGRYAWVINTTTPVLQAWDFAKSPDTTSLTSAGSISVDAAPVDLVLQNRYAYVVSQTAGTIKIYDILVPASIVLIGTVNTTATSPAFCQIRGKYMFVGCVNGGTAKLESFDLQGAELQQINAGGIEAGHLSVRDSVVIEGPLIAREGCTIYPGFTAEGDSCVHADLLVSGAINGRMSVIAVTTTRTMLTTESGALVSFGAASVYTISLPAVGSSSGVRYRFVKNSTGTGNIVTISAPSTNLQGVIRFADASAATNNGTLVAAKTNLAFASAGKIGDYADVVSDGTNWYVDCCSGLTAGITTS
jgi:hypothetical protein